MKLKIGSISLFAIVFVLGCIYFNVNHYTYITDDIWFRRVSMEEKSHLSWVIERYFTWSSRTPIEYALISVVNHYEMWSVINSVMLALLLTAMTNIFKPIAFRDKIITTLFLLIIIYSIPQYIFFSGAIWLTGSINYLWPVSLAFFGYSTAIYATNNEKTSRLVYSLCVLSLLASSFNEQLAITNLVFSSLLLGYSLYYKKSTQLPLTALCVSIFVLAYILTCPGNKIRYDAEVENWFSSYNDLNFLQKSLLGINLYADALFSHKTIIPSMAALCLSLLCKGRERYISLTSGILLLITNINHEGIYILEKVKFTEDNVDSSLSFIRVALASVFTLMVFIPTIMNLKNNLYAMSALFFFTIAIATITMLGFSPTVYASGSRTLFIPYLLMIQSSIICLTYFLNKNKVCTF